MDENNRSEQEKIDAAETPESPVSSETGFTFGSSDGEYRFVRPEARLYEDAEYVPQSESTEFPNYYVPSEKKPKEQKDDGAKPPKRRLGLKITCLCLVCALLGGIAGAAAGRLMYGQDDSNDAAADTPIIRSTGTPINSSTSTANDIYTLACSQTVGIKTEVTYTNMFGQTSSTAVSGTGFVVTTDGYIMTNYHVIEYAYESNRTVSVIFKDGTQYDASIVGVEAENDVAVLKIDATGLTPVAVGDSDDILVGDTVYAVGNPLGELDFSMTTGSISALDRSITVDSDQPAINMFQFDAAVNSGNSGGPVYNTSGEVIGIVTAKSSENNVEGIGFAIPINDAVNIANDLITKGYVTGKAYLGVTVDTRYTSVYADYYGMPEGAYIFYVEPGTCAEKAGISSGDIITKIGDYDIRSYSDLSSAIREFHAGDTVKFVVYRANDYIELSVTFDESKPNTGSNGVNESGLSSHPQSGGRFN